MPTPLQQDHSIVWGVLSFTDPGAAESNFDIEAIGEGTNFGNPVPVIEVIRSLLIDGALAARTGYDNRDVTLRLRVSANDGEGLSEAEAAMVAQEQLDQPPPLVWTPPVGLSATCVFDTVVAHLDRDVSDGWDFDEKFRGYRYYVLTLTCLPSVRPPESTVVPALPVPTDPEVPVWVDVDTITSTTGWTRETNGTTPSGPTYNAGPPSWVHVEATIDNANDYLRLVRTGSIAVPADHYLAIDISSFFLGTGSWTAYYNGTWHTPALVAPGLGENNTTRLFFADVGTISSFKIAYDFATLGPGAASSITTLNVFNVAYTDTIGSAPGATTNRQQSRLTTVSGSMPTQAAIRFYDATPAPLGSDILVYTSRNTDWRPNLRQWVDSSEPATPDSTLISGVWNTLATPTTYLIPADLLHSGSYALLANMHIFTAGALTWQARMVDSVGADTIGSSVVITGETDLAVTSGYEVVNLAAMVLPVVEVESPDYAVELTLTGTTNMHLDEAWLFGLDDGVLTWVKDTEGMKWIEIRPPELGAARPSVWGGTANLLEYGTCIDWKCESFGAHRFDPGVMQIDTICSTSLVSQAEIEYFPRFHSHVWGGGS